MAENEPFPKGHCLAPRDARRMATSAIRGVFVSNGQEPGQILVYLGHGLEVYRPERGSNYGPESDGSEATRATGDRSTSSMIV